MFFGNLKSTNGQILSTIGEKNYIDFDKLNGIVGIFGSNYSGKSSSMETLSWILYNRISKDIKKNVDIINENKDKCSGRLELEIDNKTYIIERRAEKYTKKLYRRRSN